MYDEFMAHQLENSTTILYNTHKPDECWGEFCTIHKMSDHHMRHLPQHWRDDRGIMERICEHGVGHPDLDSPWKEGDWQWVHGCDGCCLGPNGYEVVQGDFDES